MSDPWALYDGLIGEIPADLTVTAANTGVQWSRVTSSEGGIGMAYTMPVRTRPARHQAPTFVGARLRDIAQLATSWNLAEASLGMAAVNAFYSFPDRAAEAGFRSSAVNAWPAVFDPYVDDIAGKTVVVVGHFPFAQQALAAAAELIVLERSPQPGDFPDSACEYLLPSCDYAFLSGSAFVNKTAPRLLELARGARTVVLGPSTPLSPLLFEHDVDVATGFVSAHPQQLDEALAGSTMAGMHEAGYRVERER